jgi:DNA-binding transcriptional LysR family regulator
MELRHLRYFVTAAEELNFSRAAARLHVSQPPLSRQIQDLEREIGAALFDRNRRRLQLTPAGKSFLGHARQILAQTGRAARLARAVSQGKTGQITVALLSPLSGFFTPPAIRNFRQRFPLVDVTIMEMVPRRKVEALLDHRIDIGFVPKCEAQFEKGVALEPIAQVGVALALSPKHSLASSRRISFHKLANESFVVLSRSSAPATHDLLRDLCRAQGIEPHIAKESDQPQAILDSVASGIGVSVLPEFFRRYRSEAVFRPLRPDPPKIELCMAWRRHDDSETLGSLRAALRQSFRDSSPRVRSQWTRAKAAS